MQATLSSLPDEVIDSVGEKADPGEEALAERRRKLEFLQQEEELIKVAISIKKIVKTVTFSIALLVVVVGLSCTTVVREIFKVFLMIRCFTG